MRRSGFAIILVLATLLLLALLSITYIKLALIDRNIARNYMDNKRAQLIAQSGVDYAIGRLKEIIEEGWFKNGKFSSTEWIYNYDGVGSPSFADPRIITINGKPEKFSSIIASSTYGENSDLFSLKVIDTQSQININDGSKISNTHYISLNLQRILNILGKQLSPPISYNLGDKILEKRPPGGYSNKRELIKILGQDDYSKVKDFITTISWTNNSVVIPVPLSDYQTVADSYPFFNSIARPTDTTTGQKIYRYGHNLNYRGDIISNDLDPLKSKLIFGDPNLPFTDKSHGVYSTDALNPQWIELTQRSPVNINTASSEVLKALIIDLEGFFVMERRTPNPANAPYLKAKYTYDKDRWEPEAYGVQADELGYIYKTIPYYGTGGRNISGIDANVIVQEIIACRRREGSYTTANYGGLFKSWAQFNIFIDKLVEKGLIADSRGYFDLTGSPQYSWTTDSGVDTFIFVDNPTYSFLLTNTSYVQKRFASIAAGDVLKANFNPNLHLNELNPDRQLFTMVDKTDLIVNSTEFCFTPMGYFGIESTGYVLLPQGTKDSLTASDNQIVASSKIEAIVKLFDVYYETSQDRFYQGNFSERESAINTCSTNNNCAIETGPEVDNGEAITTTYYDGYMRLSTNLGCIPRTDKTTKKGKGVLWTTYPHNQSNPYEGQGATVISQGVSEYNENIHSHFQLDHVAHYHSGYSNPTRKVILPMGSIRTDTTAGPIDRYNFPDKSETRRSPYSPVDNPSRYRLCRSFRSDESLPGGELYAPSDLRSDGVYVEPHSAFAYDKVDFAQDAVVSFWIKSNWFPELGGRSRTLISMRKYKPSHSNDWLVEWPAPFDIWFHACSSDLTIRQRLRVDFTNAATKIGSFMMISPCRGIWTGALNREFESSTEDWDRFKGNSGNFNYIRGREWVLVIAHFYYDGEYGDGEILINNEPLGIYRLTDTYSSSGEDFSAILGPYIVIGGDFSSYCATNPITNTDSCSDAAHISTNHKGYLNKIFYADSTIDEFFFWAENSNAVARAKDIWSLGRYYKPQDGNLADACFTSQQVNLTASNKSPGGESTITPPAAGSPSVSNTQSNNIEILGVAWTYYAEDYLTSTEPDGTPRLKPVIWNWRNSTVNVDLNTANARSLCEVKLNINDVEHPKTYDEDGYSAVNMTLNPSDKVKYKVKFKIGSGADLNTVLLASPVFDDVTIYYTSAGGGGVKFVSYSYFD